MSDETTSAVIQRFVAAFLERDHAAFVDSWPRTVSWRPCDQSLPVLLVRR